MKSNFCLRIFDIIVSFVLILIFFPLILLVAFIIKLSNFKASVFVENHYRVGCNGKPFLMYKFRTMVPNAHELLLSDPRFKKLKEKFKKNEGKLKIDEDIRITRIGKILRKTDFDEVPQLFNVLKGDMSMVGPRAYFQEEIDLYKKKYDVFDRKIDDVLKIKPGVTGLWQISGRNLLSAEKRVEYDYKYLKKRSLILNILILLKTPYVVLSRYGAYE